MCFNQTDIDEISDKIRCTAFFGTIFPNAEQKRFDDTNYFNRENIFHYRLSKIRFFLGEKDNRPIILGLQTFFKDFYGKEFISEEARDDSEKELDIKDLDIPSNDYICNFHLRVGSERITQIRLKTIKGKEFVVGSDEGDEKILDYINDTNEYMILFFFGAYRKCLEAIAAGYIPIRIYLAPTIGFFELRKKYKNKFFKQKIEEKLDKLSDKDKVLFRVCGLPENCFNCVIKYCLF
jgi:hypothetical protein